MLLKEPYQTGENQKSYVLIEEVKITIKNLDLYLKKKETELKSAYSDLKAVFMEKFGRTFAYN